MACNKCKISVGQYLAETLEYKTITNHDSVWEIQIFDSPEDERYVLEIEVGYENARVPINFCKRRIGNY